MVRSNRRNKQHQPAEITPNTVVQLQHQQYSGLLPPPDLFEKYNRGVPDAAERILVMAEERQRADINEETRLQGIQEVDVNSGWNFALRGQFFSFVVVVIYMLILGLTVWINNTTTFCAIFGAGAVAGLPALVRSFQKIWQKP